MSVTAVPLLPIQKGSVLRLWLGVAVVAAGSALLTWNGLRPFGHSQSGLAYQILDPGTGVHPTKDDIALLSYKGTLTNGTVFDATQQPTPAELSSMIPGFAEAVTMVGKGGHILVEIPPKLAYGDQARGDKLPANSTLIFDINLTDFKTRTEIMEMQRQQQMQQMLQQQMQQQRGGAAPQGAEQGPPPEAPNDAPVLQP